VAARNPDAKLRPWIEARKRHRLSHAHVAMARELGMNPKTLGKIDNHDQEPWKAPLPAFIEHLYEKRFGRARPERVRSLEAIARERQEKKARRREEKARRRQDAATPPTEESL
jgi:SOS-response transcriptional repressor LexA